MTITNEILSHFSDYTVFTYRDVYLYASKRKIKPSNLIRLLSYWNKSGKIYRISKGVYTTKKEDSLTGFAFQPFYYGLLYALTIKELWTQNAKPEIITLKRVRQSTVPIFGSATNTIRLHHAHPRHFFGFEMVKYGNFEIPVSDNEKTLIDLFYYKIRLPIQNYSQILVAINIKKLNKYLSFYDRHTKITVTAFVQKYRPIAKKGKLENRY